MSVSVSTNKRWRDVLGAEFTLLICASGVYLFYMIFSMLQEEISLLESTDGRHFKLPITLLLGQCTASMILSAIMLLASGKLPSITKDWKRYNKIAISYSGAMITTFLSLAYVNYPTMTLAKSCKMLPIMITGLLVHGHHYSKAKFFRMILLALGISFFFLLKNSKTDKPTNLLGILFLSVSLFFDGLTGSQQDEWLKSENAPTNHQLMFGLNFWASIQLLCVLPLSGEVQQLMTFVPKDDQSQLPIILLTYFLVSAFGQIFIFLTITEFSALICSVMTTTRKFFTILASAFWFGHHLSIGQWVCVFVVFIALGWDIIDKDISKHRHNQRHHQHQHQQVPAK